MALLLNNYICESYYYEYIARLTPKKFVADDVVESGHNFQPTLKRQQYA
jgi:hypothetical protein